MPRKVGLTVLMGLVLVLSVAITAGGRAGAPGAGGGGLAPGGGRGGETLPYSAGGRPAGRRVGLVCDLPRASP